MSSSERGGVNCQSHGSERSSESVCTTSTSVDSAASSLSSRDVQIQCSLSSTGSPLEGVVASLLQITGCFLCITTGGSASTSVDSAASSLSGRDVLIQCSLSSTGSPLEGVIASLL